MDGRFDFNMPPKFLQGHKKSWGKGGGPGTETKTICQTVSVEINTKMQLSTQCRACGTIKTFQNMLISF